MHAGPVILGFDGTPASARAGREAAALLAPRAALTVVVWEAGRSFGAATLPEKAPELPRATVDIRSAFAMEKAAYDEAQRLAEHGAALAREAHFQAEGLAVADDATVAVTDLIPMIGATLGAVICVAVALLATRLWPTTVLVAVFFVAYQQLENYVLAPRIMRRPPGQPGPVSPHPDQRGESQAVRR